MKREWIFPVPIAAVVLAVALATAIAPSPATAACPRTGGTLCTAVGDQFQLTGDWKVFDGAEVEVGMPPSILFVAWTDLRDAALNGSDIFMSSIGACGDSAYSPGQVVCAEAGVQERPCIAASGKHPQLPAGLECSFGLIVAWQDGRSGSDLDIYARRMGGYCPAGPWDQAGIPICAASGDQSDPQVAGRLHGGAVIAWEDRRSGEYDVYAQSVDSAGTALWTGDGMPVCSATGDQLGLRILSDGADGAYLFWLDHRSDVAIYATHLLADGSLAPGWSADGDRVSGIAAVPLDLYPIAGAVGDVLVAWTDARTDPDGDVYAQHMQADATLAPGWPSDGLPVASGLHAQAVEDAAGDANGGAYVLWGDEPATLATESPADADLYAQHLAQSGAVIAGWPASGRVVCDAPGRQEHARCALTVEASLMAFWSDQRNGADQADLFGIRLTSDGSIPPGWTESGKLICGAPDAQDYPIVTRSLTGARIAWVDDRDRATTGADVYGGGVTADGLVVTPRVSRAIALSAARPNPAAGSVSFTLELPVAADAAIDIVDLAGRAVRNLTHGRLEAGSRTVQWNGRDARDLPAAPGVYFLRARIGGETESRRFVRMR